MKKIIFLLLLSALTVKKSQAQIDIVVGNICDDVYVQFYAYDLSCGQYRSARFTVSPNTSYINIDLTVAGNWNSQPPGTYNTNYWVTLVTVSNICNPGALAGGANCGSFTNTTAIEDGTTGLGSGCPLGLNNPDCFEFDISGCGTCASGTVVNASIGSGGSGQVINVYP